MNKKYMVKVANCNIPENTCELRAFAENELEAAIAFACDLFRASENTIVIVVDVVSDVHVISLMH